MFKVAMSVLHNEALAKETVQDCFLKIAVNIADFPEPETKKAKSFVVIMARNKALDNLKSEHTDTVEPIYRDEVVSNDVLSEISSDIGYKRLVQEILNLHHRYRDTLILKLLYGYGTGEISDLLDVSENTVKSRVYRGRKILKERLEEFYNEK